MSNISLRSKNFPSNPIRGMEPLVKDAISKGISIIPLNIGAPDTESPTQSKESIIKFLNETKAIQYGPSAGNYRLIQELTQFYNNKLGFNVKEDNLAITQGASEALDLIFYTIADLGESIATFDPTYPNYLSIAYKHGIKVIPIKTSINNSFHLDINTLEESIPKDVKAILWSSPGNPTGAVFTKIELEALLKISRERDLWLIADEVYRSLDFTTNGEGINRSLSILDIAKPDDMKRIIVLDSMSKLLGLCGARIGSVIADKDIIGTLVKQASVRGCPSTISQSGIEAINEIPDTYYSEYKNEFKERRDVLYSELKKLDYLGVIVSPNPPEGAFYLIADLGVKADIFTKWLISEYPKVSETKESVFLTPMVTDNGGFYITKGVGGNEVRMAYVIEKEQLIKAVKIIEEALKMFKKIFKL